MRRLLQFGTLMLILATFCAPVLEFFDRWDPPGLANDSEFAVFGLILMLCLVLLVCEAVARLGRATGFSVVFYLQRGGRAASERLRRFTFIVIPHNSPPLRI